MEIQCKNVNTQLDYLICPVVFDTWFMPQHEYLPFVYNTENKCVINLNIVSTITNLIMGSYYKCQIKLAVTFFGEAF